MGTLASGSIDLKSLKVASGEAISYITKIDGGGIKVHDAGDMSNYIQLTSDGMSIYKNDIEPIAKYSDTVQIGKSSNTCLFIDSQGLGLKDKTLPVFQIESNPLDESQSIENIRYSLKEQVGYRWVDLSGRYSSYNLVAIFDATDLEINNLFYLSFYCDGIVEFKPTGSSTYLTRTFTNEFCEHTFSYGVAENVTFRKTIIYNNQNYTPAFCSVSYDGNNSIEFTAFSNSSQSRTSKYYITVQLYKNIKIYNTLVCSTIPQITIGPKSLSHAIIDYHSLQMVDADNNSYFYISDLRDLTGNYIYTENYVVDYYEETSQIIDVQREIKQMISVSINNVVTTDYSIEDNDYIDFSYSETPLQLGDVVQVIYKSTGESYQIAYTVGSRTNNDIGVLSIAEGQNITASGKYSYAQGLETTATGFAQHVIGRYNISKGNNNYLSTDPIFIIGNGTPSQRSNALTVDWNGNVMSQGMAGQVIMYAGSTAPTGWLLCDGASYLREDYPELFTALGGASSPWGLPDSTHFKVPDFRNNFPVGAGSTYNNNSKGGYKDAAVITHTHSISSSGGHTHTISAKYDQDIKVESGGGTRYKATGGSTSTSMATIANDTGKHTHDVPAPTGAVAGTNRNLPPYVGINFIIATGKTY